MRERLEEIRERLIDAEVDEELYARGVDPWEDDLGGRIGAKLIANGYEAAYFEKLDEARDVAKVLREDVPWLIGRVEELEAENDKLREDMRQIHSGGSFG